MKIALFSLLIGLFLVSAVYSVDVTQHDAIEDIWVTGSTTDLTGFDVCGNLTLVLNTSYNYDNTNNIFMYIYESASEWSVRSYFKFNISSNVRDKIIYGVTFNATRTYVCSSPFGSGKNLRWLSNDSWSANTMTFNNAPDVNGGILFRPYNFFATQGTEGSNEFINYSYSNLALLPSSAINDLYEEEIFTLKSDSESYSGDGGGTFACSGISGDLCVASVESGAKPFLEIKLTDFDSFSLLFNEVGTDYLYHDFESGRSTYNTFFDEADFRYSPALNIMEVYKPSAFATTEFTAGNTMPYVVCGAYNGLYSMSTRTNINVPLGDYDIFCFNLSSDHNGKQFYGAIKFITRTDIRDGSGEEFDFFHAMYSPAFSQFTAPLYFPDPPQIAQNLSVSWTTSQAVNTNLKYRYKPAGSASYSAWFTISESPTNYEYEHTVVIPSSQMVSGDYQLYYYGNSADNSTFSSDTYSFTTIVVPVSPDNTTGGIVDGINFFTYEISNQQPRRSIVCLIGNGTDYVRLCGETRQIRNETFRYGYMETASYYGFPNGNYNYSVSSAGYRDVNGSFSVTEQPYIKRIGLVADRLCTNLLIVDTENQCRDEMPHVITSYPELNITSWYCQFDPNECRTVNGQTGLCELYGMWEGYACSSGFHPEGIPVNDSLPVGGQGTTGASTGIQTFWDSIADIFGINTEGAMAFISMIITIIISAIIGFGTKSGIIGAITFLGCIVMFTIMGWFPIIFAVMLGLISAVILARLLTQGLVGGQ